MRLAIEDLEGILNEEIATADTDIDGAIRAVESNTQSFPHATALAYDNGWRDAMRYVHKLITGDVFDN